MSVTDVETVVPLTLQIVGPAPAETKNADEKCSVCKKARRTMTYGEHSGRACAVCLGPIEHHTDEAEFDFELMAMARVLRTLSYLNERHLAVIAEADRRGQVAA